MTLSSTGQSDGPSKTIVVDHVLRYPPSGLRVLIVGAGPGGLLAALECWRKGHDVEIIEKASHLTSIGDIVALGPSAWSTLHHYPSMLEQYSQIGIDAQIIPCHMDGTQVIDPLEFEFNREGVAQHAAYPVRVSCIMGRADLAHLFYQQCQRLGIPIIWNTSIVDYDENAEGGYGVAVSENGMRYTADIVVAADGIGSKSHKLTLGKPVRAVSTGYTIYRAAMPTSELRDAVLLRQLLQENGRPQTRIYMGHNQHIIFVVSQRLISLAITLPGEPRGSAVESWASTVSRDELLCQIPDSGAIDPRIIEAIRNFPENGIVAWKLSMRNPQPKWTSADGYVVQLGDSAHSFIPTSTNGATIALEDGASLAECLRLGGRRGRSIATKAHQLLRQDRTSLVQRMGLRNRVAFHQDSSDNIKNIAKAAHQGKWLWAHNPEQYALERFDEALAHLKHGKHFENTNLPPGHKPEMWNLQGEIEKEQQGLMTELTTNGDWGLQ